MENNEHVFVNVYRNTSLYFHHGIVAFGKEYFMNKDGVTALNPGTWRGQRPIPSRSTPPVKTEKSKNDFDKFLKQPLFHAKNFGSLDNKTFSTLAYEFLTLENPTQTKTYSRAMNVVSKKKDPIKADLHINQYVNHSGIVVYGKEYFYTDGGLDVTEPGTWNGLKPIRQEKQAFTTVSELSFKEMFLASEQFNAKSSEYRKLDSHKFTNLAFEFLTYESPIERKVYVNTYHSIFLRRHFGVVVYGKEYFLEENQIREIEPGTWKKQRTLPSFGLSKITRKSKKEFEMFLTQPIFDHRLSRIDSEIFSDLASEFLTHENPTKSQTYMRAIAALGGEESESEFEVYINFYNYFWPFEHSGIVVFGKEYFFTIDGVDVCDPGTWNNQTPKRQERHSVTKVSQQHFEERFLELEYFQPKCYHFRTLNCNYFTILAHEFLTHEKPFTTANFLYAKTMSVLNSLWDNSWQRGWANSTSGSGRAIQNEQNTRYLPGPNSSPHP